MHDVAILGAGAAGLYCAARAGRHGLSVLLLDHATRVAEKIRISGGGRCNFTNLHTGPECFLSENPAFCRSALSRHRPQDFIDQLRAHDIGYHEKHRGQLFCDDGSERIVRMLLDDVRQAGVDHWQPCAVHAVHPSSTGGFDLVTARGAASARALVVATGGLSIPQIGATDFGHRLARQFGHRVVTPRPALVPLTFDATAWAPFAALAGLSLPVRIGTGQGRAVRRFDEDLLFTHRGLSGPAVLQISSYWQAGQPIQIDLAHGLDLAAALRHGKAGSRRQLGNELAQHLPRRLADTWLDRHGPPADKPLAELPDRELNRLAEGLQRWQLTPTGTEGWRKAEVTAGGVDTRELDSRSLQSRRVPGLYFIGEVVDVTGWLGGYNFQWAWSSAAACAEALAEHLPQRRI